MLEVLNTAAAVGTFVVIAATAIAAVVQLRHLRTNNQLEALLEIAARLEDGKVNAWITETRRELPAMLADPDYVRSVVDGTFDRNVVWLQLGNRYDRIGSLLKHRLIPEEPFFDVYAPILMKTWKILLPVTAILRSAGDQSIWENFEYMFVRAKAFSERYERGNYPHGVPRADVPAFQIGGNRTASTIAQPDKAFDS